MSKGCSSIAVGAQAASRPPPGQVVFADLIAHDRPNSIAEPYSLKRFETGLLIDEHGAAGVAH